MEYAGNSIINHSTANYSWSFTEVVCYEGPKRHFNKCSEHFNNLKENFTMSECFSCLGEFFITLIDAVPLLGHIVFMIEMIVSRCFEKPESPESPESIIEKVPTTDKQKRIAAKKNQEILRNATLASAAHSYNLKEDSRKRVEDLELLVLLPASCLSHPNTISDTLQLNEYNFIDPATGLKMLIATNKTNAFICFGSIQKSEEKDIYKDYEGDCLGKTLLKNVAGTLFQETTELYEEAERLVDEIIEGDALKGKKITVLGQCLNGSVATYIGLRKNWDARTFNAFPLGKKLQNRIGEEQIALADRYVTNISIEGDCMDNPYYFGIINFVSRLFCLGAPSKPGHRITIPAHQDFAELPFLEKELALHDRFLKSISEHCKNEI